MANVYIVMEETSEGDYIKEIFLKKEMADKYISLMKQSNLFIEEFEAKDEFWENAKHDEYTEVEYQAELRFTKDGIKEEEFVLKTEYHRCDGLFNPKKTEPQFHLTLNISNEVKLVNMALRIATSENVEEQTKLDEATVKLIKKSVFRTAEELMNQNLIIKNKSAFFEEKRKEIIETMNEIINEQLRNLYINQI